MARRFTLLLTVVLLAGVPGFGQIIFPGGGGGYPRQRYPQGGQGPPPSSNNQAPASTLTGMLRKIGDNNTNVVVESDDRTISTVLISGSTKYTSAAGGSAKLGDFQPGDHVSVSANQDNKNIYHAVKISMVKEGTPEEHSAASLATDDMSRPLGINISGSKESPSGSSSGASANSSGNSDPDRPKLRRATNSDDAIANSSSNNNSHLITATTAHDCAARTRARTPLLPIRRRAILAAIHQAQAIRQTPLTATTVPVGCAGQSQVRTTTPRKRKSLRSIPPQPPRRGHLRPSLRISIPIPLAGRN
jgi:hypothetical protein